MTLFAAFRILVSCLCLSALCLSDTAGGQPAFERIGPFGGDVRSLLIDRENPDVVYLGTSDGRIHKSLDAGRSWDLLLPGIGRQGFVIDTLVQHPADARHIYAGAWDLHSQGGGLFESRDSGRNWTPVNLPGRPPAVKDLAISRMQPERIVVGAISGVYTSRDGGNAWTTAERGPRDVHSVAVDSHDPDTLFAGTWQLGYRSGDFGRTWQRVVKGMPPDSDIFSIVVDGGNPATVYAGACSGVYRSDDHAQSWNRLKVLPDQFVIRTQIIAVDPTESRRIYAGTTEGLYVSQDAGMGWKRLTPPDLSVNAVQINPRNSGEILIGTEARGVLRSRDSGDTWEDSNRGFSRRNVARLFREPTEAGRLLAFTGTAAGGTYWYDADSRTWAISPAESVTGADVLSWLSLPLDGGTLAGTAQGIYWRRGRQEWTKLPGYSGKRQINDLACDPGTGTIFAGTDYGIFTARTDDLNFVMPPGIRFAPKVYAFAVSPGDSPLVLAATSLGLLESRDNGKNWRAIHAAGLPARVVIECLAMHPAAKDRLLAGTSAGLYESRDGGGSWRPCGDGSLGSRIPSVVFLDREGSGIAAADGASGGIYFSGDGGARWRKIEYPGFSAPVRSLVASPAESGVVYAGTDSDGAYRILLR